MDHVCLAAGKGTRMGELGRYLQKCMYPIGTRPFLEYTLDNLVRSSHLDQASDRLLIVVGHLGYQLEAYFGDSYRGLPIHYLEQTELLGTGHALATAAATVRPDQPVLAWLADLFVPTSLFEACAAHPLDHVLTLAPGPDDTAAEIRVDVVAGRVTRAWQGTGPDVDIGLWKLKPATLERLTAVRTGEYRFLPNLQAQIEAGLDVGAIHADEWIHLGGDRPTAHQNVLTVVDRLRNEEGRP